MASVVGVIGSGQLARMMIAPAVELGIELRVLADAAQSPAALAVTVVGDHRDLATALRFAEGVDVLTFEHEHVSPEVLAGLVDAGVPVHPGPDALLAAQDKIVMRERLAGLGVPVPRWSRIDSHADLARFVRSCGDRVVVKVPRGGYDGKGVRVIESAEQAGDWLAVGPILAEELVPFRRELAQLIARRPSGEFVAWPLVETIQRDGVCAEVIAPAPGEVDTAATVEIARSIAEGLDVTGVLAVELFETDAGVVVNELAMRPHNSGHWTIDGSRTSQFEQHLRAVLDLPLGDPSPRERWSAMVNVLGGPSDATLQSRYPRALAAQRSVKFHAYDKESRPGRKVGHVTAVGDDLAEVVASARAAAAFFVD